MRAEAALATAMHAGNPGGSSAAGESDGSTFYSRPGPATHLQDAVEKRGSVTDPRMLTDTTQAVCKQTKAI